MCSYLMQPEPGGPQNSVNGRPMRNFDDLDFNETTLLLTGVELKEGINFVNPTEGPSL